MGSATVGTGRRPPARAPSATFAALRTRNYRVHIAGQGVANAGFWMLQIAQDWLVLELTGSAAAVGVAMALQFLPMLLLGMHGGMLADRWPKRRTLAVTQSLNVLLAAALAVLTLTGRISVSLVYALTLASGLVFVVDNPTRQVFVGEVVPREHLRAAIAMNSAVFQASRLVGPAVAAALIDGVGLGWAFAATSACFLCPLLALAAIRPQELTPAAAASRAPGQLRSALRYVARRPHVAWTLALVAVVGTFGLNFPVVLTAMARDEFGGGAALYGAFNIALALGSIAGALFAAGRPTVRLRTVVLAGAVFGAAQAAAALVPGVPVFLVVLAGMGFSNLAFQAMANSSVQLWVEPELRGRVMGLYLLVFIGGTPIGAPLVGWLTEAAGPRVGMAFCGLVPLLAACATAVVLARRVRGARPG